MPIIDPDGLFHGERLAKCSNMARLFWPHFFLASNGFGRLELSYSRLIARAFASFAPVPTEAEVYGYLSEYEDNYLLFVYTFDGKAWGQWDTDRRSLPRYPTAADRRSPNPPEESFTAWKSEYRAKASEACKLQEVFRTSRNGHGEVVDSKGFPSQPAKFPKSFKLSRKKVCGIGVVVGVGGGVGVVEGKSKIKTLAADAAAPQEITPENSAKAKSEPETPDPRHHPVREFIKQCQNHAQVTETWTPHDGKALKTWLEHHQHLPLENIKSLVRDKFRSDEPRSDPPWRWIPILTRYGDGPLDRFGKPTKGLTNGHSKTEQRTQRNLEVSGRTLEILERQRSAAATDGNGGESGSGDAESPGAGDVSPGPDDA